MIRTPATPAASPSVAWDQLSGAPASLPVRHETSPHPAPLERDSSVATVAFAVVSGISALLALLVDGQLANAHPALFRVVAFYYHFIGPFLWAAPLVLGSGAISKVARFLAFPVAIGAAVVFYGWHWLGIHQSPGQWLKLVYGATSLLVGVPWLLQRLWQSRRWDAR
jgi:uncharacterized membrane protein HdeD (DUF308 family)